MVAATVALALAAALPADGAVAAVRSAAEPATAELASSEPATSGPATVASAAVTSCAGTRPTLVPVCGVWWGIWPRANAAGTVTTNLPANVAGVESALGRRFDIVSRYKGWGQQLYDGWDVGLRNSGHIVLEDLTARSFSTNTYTRWADIAAGRHDDYLRAQALRAKAFGARTFLSFNQEPEQALERGNAAGSPAEFAAAYRHVHDVFEGAGATNVVWVWWVMGWSGHNAVYPRLWPGAAYVDWIAYDPYDFNACHGRPAKTPRQTIAPWYAWVTGQPWSAGKPLMLAEYGTNGLDRGAWFAGVPAVLKTLPRLKAAVQFNSRPGSCDHRSTGSAANLAGFKAASSDPYVNPRRTVYRHARSVAPPPSRLLRRIVRAR
jgi:hypothetical protein